MAAQAPSPALTTASVAAAGDSTAAAVAGAIRQAAQSTGASFEYLLATARIESAFRPAIKAATSSAVGLFQFIEQTWLAVMKEAGARLGYGRFADAISRTASGRYVVPDPTMRSAILALREDPRANALMAGALTESNAARLAGRLGRPPSAGELYIAHFLGAGGATKLISAAAEQPQSEAAALFPRAAAANRSIFFDRNGRARSAAQVYALLVDKLDAARGSPATALADLASSRAPASAAEQQTGTVTADVVGGRRDGGSFLFGSTGKAAATNPLPTASLRPPAAGEGTIFHVLFRDESRGAVAPVVSALWGEPAARSSPGRVG